MKNHWHPFQTIDFNSDNITQIHIDTRDFHAITSNEPVKPEYLAQLSTFLKYGTDFFFTSEELKQTLLDLLNRSGGHGSWRLISFKDNHESTGWDLKYLRAYKTEHGFMLADNINRFHKKEFWKKEINKELLGFH